MPSFVYKENLETVVEGKTYRYDLVFGNHQADRSPCGTGTSAKLAMLYQEGRLDVGGVFACIM